MSSKLVRLQLKLIGVLVASLEEIHNNVFTSYETVLYYLHSFSSIMVVGTIMNNSHNVILNLNGYTGYISTAGTTIVIVHRP